MNTPTIQYYGTGRRKSSVARVFVRPGTGNILVNKKSLDDYYIGWIGRNDDPRDTDPSRKFIATMPTPAWLVDKLPKACVPFGPTRVRDAAFISFSADGLSFRMPTSADCYLQSKDDSANP